MVLSPVLLDTDVLSAIMRKNPLVLPKARAYLVEHGRFTLSIITRYEILRGLKEKDANRQIAVFEAFCNQSSILPLRVGFDVFSEKRSRTSRTQLLAFEGAMVVLPSDRPFACRTLERLVSVSLERR